MGKHVNFQTPPKKEYLEPEDVPSLRSKIIYKPSILPFPWFLSRAIRSMKNRKSLLPCHLLAGDSLLQALSLAM